MMREITALQRLLITTALGGLAWAPQAMAQEQPKDNGALSEVVVTATRQADTVNHVALNVTAVTQKAIDQSGVQSLQDLARTVPSVTFRRAGGEGNPNISIRGISSSLGAPTTGVFLDDTPLQKRDNAGSASGNGTPFPQVFDLERVEVLRGPQGTLYGGSAEGGAIRFILPQPSLTKEQIYARSEVSTTDGGGMSYDGGFALGGPIIQDKLGFRASVYMRHNGGWVDEVSMYDSHTVKPDVNSGDVRQARFALAWQPTANLKITPSLYYSEEKVNAEDIYWNNIPQFKLNAGTFINSGTVPVTGVKFSFPNTTFPGGTFGPFNQFGPGKTGNATYYDAAHNAGEVDSPKDQTLLVGNINVDYNLGDKVAVKLVTSLENDKNNGYTGGLQGIRTTGLPTATNANFVDSTGKPVVGGTGPTTFIIPGVPYQWQDFNFLNTQHSFAQEVRLSSADPTARLTWVGGFFYYTSNQHQFTTAPSNEDQTAIALRGVDEAWFLGQTNLTDIPGNTSERNLYVTDQEIAGFGEGNYMITDKLKATVGLRITNSKIGYNQATSGSVQGAPAGFVGTVATSPYTNLVCGVNPLSCLSDPTFHPFPDKPGDASATHFTGVQNETPITPKFVLSYQLTPRELFYASATQGFRAGGLNQPVPVATCQQDLTALGLTSTPITYNSDSVWSYEGGAKIGLFDGHAQINSSIFWINWKNPQLSDRLRCGQNFIVNAGEAVSKGADIQAQARFGHFTFDGSVSYTDARYTKAYAIIGTAGPIVIVNKGDNLGAPDWQANVGLQYNHELTSSFDGYVRADYQYSGKYMRTPGPGASGYDAVIVNGQETHYMSARAGISHDQFDFNLYVNNLTNSTDPIYEAHSANSALVTASTFRPREIGLQLTYRY
ncbi:MAG TPA: TonB-dependent receptor [Caulobacteraceae bacterium]|jgi:outer membrane receptor protein involved in Fe transport